MEGRWVKGACTATPGAAKSIASSSGQHRQVYGALSLLAQQHDRTIDLQHARKKEEALLTEILVPLPKLTRGSRHCCLSRTASQQRDRPESTRISTPRLIFSFTMGSGAACDASPVHSPA